MLTATSIDANKDRWFLGTQLRILADAADTGGALTVMEQRAPKGFSPPLHVHDREDTAILVLSGVVTVRVGGDERVVGAGELAWLPRQVPHTFRVDSDEVHLLELATPSGVEEFHVAASEHAQRDEIPPPSEPDVAALAAAFARFGGEILGPPMH
jgi:quercetin dioxygenase-like cupin family protein